MPADIGRAHYFDAIEYVKVCVADELPCRAVTLSSHGPGLAAVLMTIGMAPVASGAGRSATCFARSFPPTKNSTWIFGLAPSDESGYTTKNAYGLALAARSADNSGMT